MEEAKTDTRGSQSEEEKLSVTQTSSLLRNGDLYDEDFLIPTMRVNVPLASA